MSTTEVTTSYLSISYFKSALNITNTKNDEQIADVVYTANTELDMRLKPYLGSAPLEEGTEIFIQAKKTALRFAYSLWYERTGQLERAKHSEENFEKKMERLIMAVKADKPERTETVFVSGPDPLDRTYQTANTDEYLTREFF